ncbi:ApeP family dehydratase [Glaciimonas immobilis]|uniref:Putative hotdog family 3-hydroxylacyl-ACP dehydratase n=1 Tax=Glaciimonas immobilis TaxID=728004 RepID=A0A840RKC0_9BURK|nr:3-hydroxylacyl-ACP dehydratase [Glaciimonas immobilis]MBB5198233.1 putative hotdog family 3-hydroxylacyl-ACP dehydratase [Glaciimonas immobilis]
MTKPTTMLPDIRSVLPHSGAMVLLDRILSVQGDRLLAEVTIRPDSLFTGIDGVGSWIGLEYMAQAIAAFAGCTAHSAGKAAKVGFLLGARRYTTDCSFFAPDAVLHVAVQRILQADNGLGSFGCQIYQVINDSSVTNSGNVSDAASSADEINAVSCGIANTDEFNPYVRAQHATDRVSFSRMLPLAHATITVFQPSDVTSFLEGMAE